MKRAKSVTLRVFTLALAATMAITFAIPAKAASDPIYNPATAMAVSGVITAVSDISSGQALESVHVLVKSKNGNFDVYLGPRNFLNFLKTSFTVGEGVDVIGSRVNAGATDVILAREVYAGTAILTLRDSSGAEVWKNWGVGVKVKAT